MKPDPISAALENAPDPATEDVGAVEDPDEVIETATGEAGDATGEAGGTGATGEEPLETEGEEPSTSDLLTSIAALSAQVSALTIQSQAAPLETDPVIEKPEPIDFSEIVTEELFEEVTNDRKKFVSLLNTVATAARDKAVEHSARSIPVIAASEVNRTMSAAETAGNFYKVNKDLAQFKPTVRAIFEDMIVKNPGLSPAEILNDRLAPEVRSRLGLKAPVAAAKKTAGKRPNTAPGTGGRTTRGGKPTPTAAFEDSLKKMGG